jgi:hypothetical protein
VSLATALWKRLDVPGHDAAVFNRRGDDWQLLGTAVFRGEDGPVAASYEVLLDGQYRAWRGSVRGLSGGRSFSHQIVRGPDGWRLDGHFHGLPDIIDLDFGFTPATNLPQVSRIDLAIGGCGIQRRLVRPHRGQVGSPVAALPARGCTPLCLRVTPGAVFCNSQDVGIRVCGGISRSVGDGGLGGPSFLVTLLTERPHRRAPTPPFASARLQKCCCET